MTGSPFRAAPLVRALWLGLACALVAPPSGAESLYAASGWASLHQSGENRRAQPVDLPAAYRTWHALAGASVLTSPVLGPEGHLYVTTGLGRGHANLHAFTLEGTPLWESAPWQDRHGLDACAILSSPIVDRDGDVYVSDCNQLWAFTPTGRVKWVIELPAAPAGAAFQSPAMPVNAFTTAAFTREGQVLGVTNFGQVVIADRATGALVAEVFQLPGLIPARSTKHALVDSILGGGLMDPALRDWAWQLLFGGSMRSANTPAVDPRSGRIFVAASSAAPGRGALYGLSLRPAADGRWRVELEFTSDMGPGSGSSPALSPDGAQVYVSDDRGMFYAFDSASGALRWQQQTRAAAAAAAVAPDGTVVVLQESTPFDVALSPDGQRLWESDIGELAAAALPERWYLGGPVAIANGNPVIVNGLVLTPVVYSYTLGWGRFPLPLPVRSALLALDLRTGRALRDVLPLRDDSSGVTAVLPDGTILNSLGALMSSGTSPLQPLSRWLLPAPLVQLPVVGGFQVARPAPALH